MLPKDNNSGLGCLSFAFLFFGLIYFVWAIIALKTGETITLGRGTQIQISPWIAFLISIICFGFGIVGIIKIWKDKDKFPPL
jgi:hypothetical protein